MRGCKLVLRCRKMLWLLRNAEWGGQAAEQRLGVGRWGGLAWAEPGDGDGAVASVLVVVVQAGDWLRLWTRLPSP